MTRFDNDFVTDPESEFLYIKTASGYHKISGGHGKNHAAVFSKGKTTHCHKENGVYSEVKFDLISDGRARVVTVNVTRSENQYPLQLVYGFLPILNWTNNPTFVTYRQSNNLISVTNLLNNQRLFVKLICERNANINPMELTASHPFFEYYIESPSEQMYFVMSQDAQLIESVNKENLPFYQQKSAEYFKNIASADIVSGVKSFDMLVNNLPYQIMSSRINGKLGFYQVGGATGFRDQLQDSLAFLHSGEIVRNQILYSASHQYSEGDVMHWWHHPKFGLRTRITDDKLFLPYAVTAYIEWTGDNAILDTELPYLKSEPLKAHEESRLETPRETDFTEPLFKHCLRAIKSSLRYGEHNLLIMGTGDWNDGMDAIGALGKGESVFNSMFAYAVLREFSLYCPEDLSAELTRVADELKEAINTHAFEHDRYKRLYSDDGRWLGSENSSALQLDLLVQSFAVLSGVADEERGKIVLETAKKLIDENAGIIKLLSPPQTMDTYLGYISGYPKGVRENGGQYTHAAMWYLMALTKIGRIDEAFELFQMLNPAEKCRYDAQNAMYKGEPYVLSGDVYANIDNFGRMGWSWYTGSAAWAYKLVTEHFYGLKRRGNKLYIEPKLPKALNNSTITYRYKNSSYVIEYRMGKMDKTTVDGEVTSGIVNLENGKRSQVIVEVAPVLTSNE